MLWPLHQREVTELDDEFTPDKQSGEEVTCDESDSVLRPRASLKARWVCKVRKDIKYPMAVLSACAAKATQLAYRRRCYLIRYLKNTPQLGLTFDGRQSIMEGYADADHNVQPDGRSYTGVVIRMAGCPIVGFTRKQTIATTSTACAEILALSALVQKMSEI